MSFIQRTHTKHALWLFTKSIVITTEIPGVMLDSFESTLREQRAFRPFFYAWFHESQKSFTALIRKHNCRWILTPFTNQRTTIYTQKCLPLLLIFLSTISLWPTSQHVVILLITWSIAKRDAEFMPNRGHLTSLNHDLLTPLPFRSHLR